MLQFEPERFADGLLGIGVAGGTSSPNEGAVLAARLDGLRKERSERAATLKEEDANFPEVVSSFDTDTIGPVPVEMAPAVRSSNRKKNSTKKKKKNKRKR